jgi:thiol-disulfide isomerase/thioredoxin
MCGCLAFIPSWDAVLSFRRGNHFLFWGPFMRRVLLTFLLSVSICFPLTADDEPKKVAEPAGEKGSAETEASEKTPDISSADALKAAPNDLKAWRQYLTEQLTELRELVDKSPDAAKKKLAEIRTFVESVSPDEPAGKTQAKSAKITLDAYDDLIALAEFTLEELGKQLKAAPDDVVTIRRFTTKLQRELAPQTRAEPDKAQEQLTEANAIFTAARDAATTDEAKKAYETLSGRLTRLQSDIDMTKKHLALIGQDAAPLKVDAWVNGDPLTDADLKGKVVLLDFWAIWCGPCIATFPNLREWNEKYEKKGLVMIGLTNYYGLEWDEKTGRTKRAEEEVTHEKEHEMLKKFAEHHKLTHRFGVQMERKTSEYYEVSYIPQVVVIDQAGKIRLISVGTAKSNEKEISELLEKLLSGEKVAGK